LRYLSKDLVIFLPGLPGIMPCGARTFLHVIIRRIIAWRRSGSSLIYSFFIINIDDFFFFFIVLFVFLLFHFIGIVQSA